VLLPNITVSSSSVWQINFFQSMFCIIYIMETFPLEFFDLISSFDFLKFFTNLRPIIIFNTVIFISKWEIWKIRKKVKYNQSRNGYQTIFNTWKTYFTFICFYISL
jgi:hypothetical protein